MSLRFGLEGKRVLLTGAAGGIGRALAQAFADQGAELWLLDRAAAWALLPLEVSPAGAKRLACDLGSDDEVAALVDELALQLRVEARGMAIGGFDVLIHNAGTEYPTPLADEAPDAMPRWATLLDNNVTSMARLTRALLPLLPPGGSIICQSSIWGQIGVPGFSAYCASKHAVIGLCRSLAFELAPRGLRVNAVCPGWVRTEAAWRSLQLMARERGLSEAEMEREITARQAVPRLLEPEELAGTFLFLASAGSAALTGQSISVSHGEVML